MNTNFKWITEIISSVGECDKGQIYVILNLMLLIIKRLLSKIEHDFFIKQGECIKVS